jgi:hypothetical protein
VSVPAPISELSNLVCPWRSSTRSTKIAEFWFRYNNPFNADMCENGGKRMLMRFLWMVLSFLIGAALMGLLLWALGILPPYPFFKTGEFLVWISPLVAAIATAYIAYFTLILKEATDKLWRASERQLAQFEGTASCSKGHQPISRSD